MSAQPAFPQNLHVLIMAGGSGTRFWPRSRAAKPKQLLALWDDETLLEHTVGRFARQVAQQRIWIVTTEALVEPSRKALGERFAGVRFLGEPAAKNTAACILWGVHEITREDPDAVIAVMPADHHIGDTEAFLAAVATAAAHARDRGAIVTLGITPAHPETGYGYIELEGGLPEAGAPLAARKVAQFVEKPDLATAKRYVDSRRFVWNAGMFIFTARLALEAFSRTMPSLARLFAEAKGAGALPVAGIYSKITKADAVSVDYGVMERAPGAGIAVAVVPVECGWNDVGSFPALADIGRETRGEVVALDAESNVVQTDSGLVALLGVKDLVVVRDGDVVLVTTKSRAQDIKLLLDKVKASHPNQI